MRLSSARRPGRQCQSIWTWSAVEAVCGGRLTSAHAAVAPCAAISPVRRPCETDAAGIGDQQARQRRVAVSHSDEQFGQGARQTRPLAPGHPGWPRPLSEYELQFRSAPGSASPVRTRIVMPSQATAFQRRCGEQDGGEAQHQRQDRQRVDRHVEQVQRICNRLDLGLVGDRDLAEVGWQLGLDGTCSGGSGSPFCRPPR